MKIRPLHDRVVVKRLEGDDEKKELERLLKERDSNMMEYNKLKETWNYSSPIKLNYDISEEEEWNKISSAIAEERFNEKGKRNSISEFFDSLFAPKFQNVFALGTAAIILITKTPLKRRL